MSANWIPTRYTPSLTGTEDFVTDGDRLIRVVEKYWQEEDVEGQFILDDWQKWLIRHALERYPDDWPVEELRGRLRYRQLLISMGRQNGKSILGAIFGIYGLLFHEYSPKVIGVAYSAKTAEVVYNRVAYTLNNVKQFKSKVKVTKTSGIRRKDSPGEYIIKPNSEKAVQGFPITMCVYDEVHITTEKLWSAAKQGTKTKKDGIIIGLTTAGDDTSELLKSLYAQGDAAIADPQDQDLQRFGFFLWEAPEGSTLEDDEAIKAANPAVACGRVSLANVKSDAKTDHETEQQRYVLNRFVASTAVWLPVSAWNACAGKGIPSDYTGPVVYSVDRAPDWQYATITAAAKIGGVIHTEVVASIVKPSLAQLVRICVGLRQNGSCTYVMDGYQLPKLAQELKQRGLVCHSLSLKELSDACSTSYALIVQKKVEHANDPLLTQQMPRGIRKNAGESWRISRADSSVEIDALLSTVMGIYLAETLRRETVQMF